MDTLDQVVEKKVKPMLEDAMREYLGIRVEELTTDISDRLRRSTLLESAVDVSVPFKKAKLQFKKQFLQRLMQFHYGNITEVARLSGIDRRSVHRLIKGVNPDKFRRELHRHEFYVEKEVESIISESTEQYKSVLAPDKYQAFYQHAPGLSKNIVKELPLEVPSLDQAEDEWERRYLSEALTKYGPSPVMVAKKIGLRYETFHRKLQKHKII